MNPFWLLKQTDKKLTARLSSQLNIHPITAQILANRGIKTSDEGHVFLNPKLSYLPDPFLLPDMEKATERTLKAIECNENIAVFGDYDTDGITSTALLVRFFKECGRNAAYYIPNRLSEGYGLNTAGVDKLKESGTTLIITADNGSNSHEVIDYARSQGIDIIVTDHHEVPSILPNASALVNPKRLDKDSEFINLAGVGVAFYFICALRSKLRIKNYFANNEPDLKNYLDLVALGTIADVVPLTELNRILVKQGVEILKNSTNLGIRALAEAASTPLDEIDSTSIAFRLSPRINAAGRLGDHNLALELLTTENLNDAIKIASKLNKMNSERQRVEKKILVKLENMIKETCEKRESIVLWSNEWHPGVIGIAASRIAEAYRKPCALISIDGESGRGSVRSVGEFNIMKVLTSCGDKLKNYGGHKAAGGFDIEVQKLEEFSEVFEEHTLKNITDEDKTPKLNIDAEIKLSDINVKLINEINQLSPFGESNPRPMLKISNCAAKHAKVVGTGHLKLTLSDNIVNIDAIGFGLGKREIKRDDKYSFVGVPELNHWNGRTSVQFKIKDLKAKDL